MKRILYSLFILIFLFANLADTLAFCGFYVAKAGAKLYNKSSEVILYRDGQKTVVTMSNDFQGDVKDFAMVVPVPVVLKEKDIQLIDPTVFGRLDAYSGPRLVEYYDNNPCNPPVPEEIIIMEEVTDAEDAIDFAAPNVGASTGVTIEAAYSIGEYDILILSATESKGLETWLKENDYQIPDGADEVLEPYIKSELKFFVVKVNLEEFEDNEFTELRPIQITYEYEKFMLPIRLGMANANGTQDLTIYAFSKQGRIECTNYRTEEIPTDKEVPLFIQNRFSQFYTDLFDRAWRRAGRNAVFVEYAWDISSSNYVKCDPCASEPPQYADLRDAGVLQGSSQWNDLHFTRLHVRYDRKKFPQDLMFQETPNKESFQGRYVLRHPAKGDLDCPEGKEYLRKLQERKKEELKTLAYLTGWNPARYDARYLYDPRLPNAGAKPDSINKNVPDTIALDQINFDEPEKETQDVMTDAEDQSFALKFVLYSALLIAAIAALVWVVKQPRKV